MEKSNKLKAAADPEHRQKAPPRSKATNRHIPVILRPGAKILTTVQETCNRIFTPSLNPFYYLGAITFLMFWILLISGTYLFFFYEMNPQGAYASIQMITEDQKYYGGIMRSLHRYASDGIMLVIGIHVLQVMFSDRFRRYRWVAWVSGAVIIPAMWFEGITGYVLVWDQQAQMIALATSDLFDALSISSEPLRRNFLANDTVNPLLFFVLNYLHMAIPIVLLILAWVHCMRISMPLVNPPKQLTWAILILMVGLSLVKPAQSAPAADLGKLVGEIQVDWFYVPFIPVIYAFDISPQMALIGGGVAFLMFTFLPWMVPEPEKKGVPQSTVPQAPINLDESKCTGCMLCQQACPFEALKIVPDEDGGVEEAVVYPTRCAECGFCVSACEFGAVTMGDWDKSVFKKQVDKVFTDYGETKPELVAIICDRAFDLVGFLSEDNSRMADNPEVAVMTTPCIGIVSPSMVDQALESGAKGVVVVGCRPLDCHYREARRRLNISKEEDDYQFLVEKMDEPRLMVEHVSPLQVGRLIQDIDTFGEAAKAGTLGGKE